MENENNTLDNLIEPIVFARKKLHHMGFLNTFWLKIIAIICMTMDHVGVCIGTTYVNGKYYLSGLMTYDTYSFLRTIGRIAFPIFCYLIVEGFFHTRDVLNYAVRLLIFALISQIPFSLMTRRDPLDFSMNLNVYFTLFLGLVTIATIDHFRKLYKKNTINLPVLIILGAVTVLCTTTFAETIHSDYSSFGVMCIVLFYVFRDKPILLATGLFLAIHFMSNPTELYALIALIPIILHNHKKGPSIKYTFYVYYPVHMLVLYFIYNSMI